MLWLTSSVDYYEKYILSDAALEMWWYMNNT